MEIRAAISSDLAGVAEIYAREAVEGTATFDVEPRSRQQWEERLAASGPGDHFLVAVVDGTVLGYATSGPYRPKPAYGHTRETTVYVAPHAQSRGVGRRLYDELLARCSADEVHLVVAAVALPNPGSLALHRSCGYEEVGTLREVGRKHGRWIDVMMLQRILA